MQLRRCMHDICPTRWRDYTPVNVTKPAMGSCLHNVIARTESNHNTNHDCRALQYSDPPLQLQLAMVVMFILVRETRSLVEVNNARSTAFTQTVTTNGRITNGLRQLRGRSAIKRRSQSENWLQDVYLIRTSMH